MTMSHVHVTSISLPGPKQQCKINKLNEKLQSNLGTVASPPLMAENNYAKQTPHWLQLDTTI